MYVLETMRWKEKGYLWICGQKVSEIEESSQEFEVAQSHKEKIYKTGSNSKHAFVQNLHLRNMKGFHSYVNKIRNHVDNEKGKPLTLLLSLNHSHKHSLINQNLQV